MIKETSTYIGILIDSGGPLTSARRRRRPKRRKREQTDAVLPNIIDITMIDPLVQHQGSMKEK